MSLRDASSLTAARGGRPLGLERGLQESSFPGFRVAPARCGGSGAAAPTPGAARAGPPLSTPARHSGAGQGHPHGPRPARHLERERRTCGAAGREAVGAGLTARGSGNLEIWNPGNLRGCGARQVFRFSGFQVFTLSGPQPAAGRRPGRGWFLRRRPGWARTGNLRI